MFQLTDQRAKLTNVNPRAELNGTDHKLAADLQIEVKVSNNFLKEFDSGLKDAFYMRSEGEQLEFDVIADVDHRTKLRFPLMGGPIKWTKDLTGYVVLISYGLGGSSDISMGDCKIDKFSFLLQEGGTVVASWRILAHPESADLGKLCELIQQEITLSLTPPKEEDLQQKLPESEERSEARDQLNKLFQPGDGPPDPNDDDGPRDDEPDTAGGETQASTDPMVME
jgi:hypothetical protein